MTPKNVWKSEIELSFGERDGEKAADARELWPVVALTLSDHEIDQGLELRFDESVDTLLKFTVGAILDATDEARSWAVPVTWYYRRGDERVEREKSSLIYRPIEADEESVAVDLVVVPSEAAPEGGKGRFNEDVELDSELPIDPVPVSVTEQLSALAEAGRETLAFYRDHGTDPSAVRGSLPALVEDVEDALESVQTGDGPVFDTSLERYEKLFLENPTTTETVHGPIQDEWLRAHALETDVIDRLIDERIRAADTETARRWYKALFMIEDEITDRTLDALATDPDQRAIGGLLLFVWDDDPQFAPQAVSILGSLLAAHDTFEETQEEYQDVLQQVRNLTSGSDHASIRAAATEALETVD